jgi:hypothetical protein
MPIDIREATADEGNDLALLRFRWHAERHPSDRYDIVD